MYIWSDFTQFLRSLEYLISYYKNIYIYIIHFYKILKCVFNFRYEEHPIINKKVNKTVECYNNKVECQTVQELLDMKDDNKAIHFESLIIR